MSFFKNFFTVKKQKTLPEILLVDKPKGITSFDVIRELKKLYGDLKIGHAAHSTSSGRHTQLKIGHAGTLDPLATGLLIIGIGEGTRKMDEFLKLSKVYEAHVLVGTRTDTGDITGKIIEEKEVSFVDEKEVEKVLKGMVGDIMLKVPVYSAVKQQGEPLYKKARRGEKVEPPERKMRIFHTELLGILKEGKEIILFIEMEVGSGTYVRSIVEEIGKRLGVPATVKELRRTKIGDFNIRDAQRLEEI